MPLKIGSIAESHVPDPQQQLIAERLNLLDRLAGHLNVAVSELESRIEALQAEQKAAQKRIEDTESRLRSAEIAGINREVAARLNMPAALASRLQGEDETSIEADAKALMAALPKPAAPNINSGAGAGATPQAGAMSEADKKEMAARLGVDWRFLP